MKRHSVRSWLLLACLGLLLGGCGSDNNDTNTLGSDPYVTEGGTARVMAYFDPGPQIMPLPNDVVWLADGDPQVELAPAAGDSAAMAQLKALVGAQGLLGLSPNMFLTVPVSGSVDTSTLEFLVFRTDDPQLPALLTALATNNAAGIQAALAAMEIRTRNDFVIGGGSGVVKLLPKKPFKPGSAYAVAVRSTLKDSLGYAVTSSITMRALKTTTPFAADSPYYKLEALRAGFNSGNPSLFGIVQGVSGAATGNAWSRNDVLVLWTFHTAASTLSLTPTTAGAETVPYPTAAGNAFLGTNAAFKGLSTSFTANNLTWLDLTSGTPTPAAGPVGIPAAAFLAGTGIPTTGVGNIYFGLFQSPIFATGGQTTGSVTFLLTVPSTPEPAGGYPVVVFQHGITSSKNAALPITSAFAQAGYATLAIDAPFHGSRTTPGAASGDGFFTTNLLQSRANVYQAAIDLWETVDVITAGIDLDGVAGADLDAGHVQFVAHSLGSIIGSVFLTEETRVQKMVLSSPSALLVNVLDETHLPTMQALVTSLGYTPGSTSFYVFLNLAQWLLDPVDATYNGIGSHSPDDLLTVFAYGDPIVSTNSTRVFLSNLGLSLDDIVAVDPATVGVSFPAAADFAGGDYQYGIPGHPVVHSFLVSPLFDPTAEPYYSGYSTADQGLATTGAQMQAAGFLAK